MPRFLMVCAVLLGLAGCQVGNYTRAEGPFFYEQVHSQVSKVILREPLTIPAQQVRTYIQGGRPVSSREVQKLEANCQFEVRQYQQGAIEIKPDEFNVIKVVHSEDLFSRLGKPLMVASSTGGDGAADLFEFSTRLTLSSPRQPNVAYFTCSHMEHLTNGGDHLRYNQFLQAVGNVVKLTN